MPNTSEKVEPQNPSSDENAKILESRLAVIKQQRSIAKGNVSRIKKILEERGTSLSQIDLECRLDILNSYIRQLMAYQTEVEKLCPSDTKRDELEEVCIGAKSLLISMLGNRRRESTVHETTLNIPAMTPSNRLPSLKIPKFSGKYAEYTNFISTFKSLVDSEESLSTIEKFNHLVSCLTDDALRTVKAFQINDENYPHALARLAERYDNKCLIFQDLILTLFNLQKIQKPSATALRHVVDTVSAVLDSLSHLGTDKEITHALVINLVLSKVDSLTKTKWEEQLNFTTLPNWSDCTKVLIRRCQYLEISDQNKHDNIENAKKNSNFREKRQPQHTLNCTQISKQCLYCSSNEHEIIDCLQFKSLNVEQRFNYSKSNSICINCLKKGHSASKCRGQRCSACQRPHNILLHRFDSKQIQNSEHSKDPQAANTLHTLNNSNQTLLATAVVQIRNKFGSYIMARVLLDSGSQVNLITEDLAQKLCLKRKPENINIIGVGKNESKIAHSVETFVKSRVTNYEFSTKFYVIRSISGCHPDTNFKKEILKIPDNIPLADPSFNHAQKIDLLLGAENFYELQSIGQIKLGNLLPTIQKTLLGWVISGKISINDNPNSIACNLASTSDSDLALNDLVQQFWKLEEIPKRTLYSAENLACEKHFSDNVRRLPNGKFEVKLPFKSDPSILGESFSTAKRRFLSLERRLSKNPEHQIMYNSFMNEYLALGHMSPTNDKIPNSSHYFIPHQCVLRPQSTTTKMRVVFDASSLSSTHISLNETLMVGPTIQNDLFFTILKFRLHRFAITADVCKMYRQVQVAESDRKYQLIVWRENPTQPLHIFQLNTVTYGTSPAPFLAIRCLKAISDEFKEKFPIAAKVIESDFYVDDLLSGADDINSLHQLRTEITQILDSCGFKLAKWFSNHTNYQSESDEKLLGIDSTESTKTLGIFWKPLNDLFYFKLEDTYSSLQVTKRNILSVTSRLFDPLGLLGPIIIKPKILIQELWLNQLDWDETIPQHLNEVWQNFINTLSKINLISIPRFVGTTKHSKIEIHGFADASMRAYGCAIYVRCENSSGISVQLLTAKSKVAPTQTRTVPRLELCAAHLLAKLWNSIKPHFHFHIENIIFWSDSEITLHWLRNHPSSLSVFVGNRIAEIQEWSESVSWRHVPTRENPADLISRGCEIEELLNSIWFCGPKFLYKDSSEWPNNTNYCLPKEISSLEKRKTQFSMVVSKDNENFLIKIIEKYSSVQKLIRVFAYIFRFLYPIKLQSNVFSPIELEYAFLKIVEILQKSEFETEIKLLKEKQPLKSQMRNLCPFLHEYEFSGHNLCLLRVGGRLLNAPLDFNAKFPLILSKNSHFCQIYVRHLHISNCHVGPKGLVALLRQKIWIVNAKEIARKIVRTCVNCFKFKPQFLSQLMGNLPEDRFVGNRAFLICGVDFCGPIYTTLRIRGKQPIKTYIAVFVCFATKAVHLEAVNELSTDAFLCTLNRFIGRRGLPRKIWCDNGRNFVGSANLLSGQILGAKDQEKIQQSSAQRGIDFQFIPPRAPNFGGLWEAAVKSAKYLLLRATANANLTYEDLTTVLVDIEAILNSRPIGMMTDDPSDGECLTPGHFLIGTSMKAIPTIQEPQLNLNLVKRYQMLSCLRDRFWRSWLQDYVLEQQQRTKWVQTSKNVQPGTLVMIHEDNIAPQKWLVGKIVKTISGSDGQVRVAEILTKMGLCKRPIRKLAPLPILDNLQPSSYDEPCNVGDVK